MEAESKKVRGILSFPNSHNLIIGESPAVSGSNQQPSPTPSSQTNSTKANVVVAHLKEGLEVVHLYTGRTLCRVKLHPGGFYSDLNGDNLIDRVQAFPQHAEIAEHNRPSCLGAVSSGLPVLEQLFNGTICQVRSSGFGDFLARLATIREEGEPIQVANPITIPRFVQSLSLLGCILNRYSCYYYYH